MAAARALVWVNEMHNALPASSESQFPHQIDIRANGMALLVDPRKP